MFTMRWTYYPTNAGMLDLLELEKEWVKDRQSKGDRIGLLRDAVPVDGARFQTITFFDSLADYDKQRERNRSDTSIRNWIDRTVPLVRAPWRMALFEVVVPVPTLPRQGEYLVRFTGYPAAGRGGDYRATVVDVAKRLQTQGVNIGATWQHFAQEGASAQWILPLKKFGDWEQLQEKVFSDPAVQAFGRAHADIARKPTSQAVWELITEAPQR